MKAFVLPYLLVVLMSIQLFPALNNWFDSPSVNQADFSKPLPPDSIAYGNVMHENENFLRFKNGHQNRFYYSGSDSFLYLYSEVSAPKLEIIQERTPLNIALVIDRSGSMMGDKFNYTKEAAKFVIDNLNANDRVSIITYETGVQVVAESQLLTDKQHLKNLIDKLETGGSTNLSGGMFEGYAQVEKHKSIDFVNRVLLMSDGLANQGISDSATLVQAVAKKLETTGISLSTFGVGADFNENLMQSLAEYGGNYYFIGSPDEIPKIFAKELNGLLLVAAQNLTLSIEMPDGVTLDKVFAYRYKQENKTIQVDFRDIFSEEKKAVLLRFKVDPQANHTLIFQEQIDFVKAADGSSIRIEDQTQVEFLTEPGEYSKFYNETVLQQIILFESNAYMEDAMAQIDAYDYEGAKENLKAGRYVLERYRYITPDNEELNMQDSLYNSYEINVDKVKEMKEEERKHYQKDFKMDNYEMRKKK